MSTPLSQSAATVTGTDAVEASTGVPRIPTTARPVPGSRYHYRKNTTLIEWKRSTTVATTYKPGRIAQNLNSAEEQKGWVRQAGSKDHPVSAHIRPQGQLRRESCQAQILWHLVVENNPPVSSSPKWQLTTTPSQGSRGAERDKDRSWCGSSEKKSVTDRNCTGEDTKWGQTGRL